MAEGLLYVVNVMNLFFYLLGSLLEFDFCHIFEWSLLYDFVVQYGADTLTVQLSLRLFLYVKCLTQITVQNKICKCMLVKR
jgi:hypothetical protein